MRRLVDPVRYGLEGQPHDLWARLRLSPMTWCSARDYPPIWAVTRHADVRAVSVAPHVFSSRTEVVATPLDPPRGPIPPSILGTDPPEHRDYRNLTLPYFKPRALRPLAARIREITRAPPGPPKRPPGRRRRRDGWTVPAFQLKCVATMLACGNSGVPVMCRVMVTCPVIETRVPCSVCCRCALYVRRAV